MFVCLYKVHQPLRLLMLPGDHDDIMIVGTHVHSYACSE